MDVLTFISVGFFCAIAVVFAILSGCSFYLNWANRIGITLAIVTIVAGLISCLIFFDHKDDERDEKEKEDLDQFELDFEGGQCDSCQKQDLKPLTDHDIEDLRVIEAILRESD